MAEQNEPRLVSKDGERKTPEQASVTRGDLIEFGKAIGAGLTDLASRQDAKTETLTDALSTLRSDLHKGEYNIANFENRSDFNPYGENANVPSCRPRPKLIGEIRWAGPPVIWHEQTHEEIELLNQLQPGIYHNGDWVVRDLQPDIKGSRKLEVTFPCKTADEKMALPNEYWDARATEPDGKPIVGRDPLNPLRKGRRVTGMEVMLREMVEEAESRLTVA